MKNKIKLSSIVFLSLLTCFMQINAQKTPSKKSVLVAMKKTNGYFMNKWPDPGASITTNITRPSNIWTRAVYYEGLMDLYKLKPKKQYYQYAEAWGVKHHWDCAEG